MKTLLLTLLLAVSVNAQEFFDIGTDEIACDTTGRLSGFTVTTGALWDTGVDSLCWSDWQTILPDPVDHYNGQWYVEDIIDKCDTIWTKVWVPFTEVEGVQFYKRMGRIDSTWCYPDTVWAAKELYYFTPDEAEKLRKLID